MTDFEQRVRERAYHIWEDEGRVFGCADAHWLRAETELQAREAVDLIRVQAAPPALTLAVSPAELLKPKRSRAAKVEAETTTVKTATAKTAAVKTAALKDAATKTTKAPAKAAAKSAGKAAKPAAKAEAKAPRTVARARTAEMVATVH